MPTQTASSKLSSWTKGGQEQFDTEPSHVCAHNHAPCSPSYRKPEHVCLVLRFGIVNLEYCRFAFLQAAFTNKSVMAHFTLVSSLPIERPKRGYSIGLRRSLLSQATSLTRQLSKSVPHIERMLELDTTTRYEIRSPHMTTGIFTRRRWFVS